jgi:hypothetical protein
MELERILEQYAAQPITHELLLSVLAGYRHPNDKIHHWIQKGVLQPLRRGLYLLGPVFNALQPHPFLLANHILGESYVSLESALVYHGLIAGPLPEVTSMTTHKTRKFRTSKGAFSYRHVPEWYYELGIDDDRGLAEGQTALVASAEKALFDKIITTPGISFRNEMQARCWLLRDMHLDRRVLAGLNFFEMRDLSVVAPKKETIGFVLQVLDDIRYLDGLKENMEIWRETIRFAEY